MSVPDVRALLFDLAPELETTVTAEIDRVDRFIGYAAIELDVAEYEAAEIRDGVTADDYLNRSNALLAAHKLTLRARGGSAQGPIQSKRVGDLSITYAVAATTEAMESTAYGSQYNEFRRIVFPGAIGI